MKMKHVLLLAVLGMSALWTAGCNQIQTATRVKPAGISPFLQQPELMTKQKATFPFHYFYMKKNAGKYKNIYVAPVNVTYLRNNENWARLDQTLAEKLGTDIAELAKYTEKTFAAEIAKNPGPRKLNVVNTPDQPSTLIVELAIVTIVPTKAELNVLGTAGNLLLPGIGVLAGHVAAGSVTIECMVRDAKTKEIVAMFANTEKDQKAIINIAGMTWYNSAKKNIKKQAEHTAKVFSGADYSYTYRRLIKIIEF